MARLCSYCGKSFYGDFGYYCSGYCKDAAQKKEEEAEKREREQTLAVLKFIGILLAGIGIVLYKFIVWFFPLLFKGICWFAKSLWNGLTLVCKSIFKVWCWLFNNTVAFILFIIAISIPLVGIPLLLCLYLLPSIIAFRKGNSGKGKTLILNILFAWTLVGWGMLFMCAVRPKSNAPTSSATSTEKTDVL